MSVTYIDTAPKEVRVEDKASVKFSTKLFLKSIAFTILVTLGVTILIGLLLGVIIYPKTKVLGAQVEATYEQAKKVEDALEAKNIDQAEAELAKLKSESRETREEFSKLSFTKY